LIGKPDPVIPEDKAHMTPKREKEPENVLSKGNSVERTANESIIPAAHDDDEQ